MHTLFLLKMLNLTSKKLIKCQKTLKIKYLNHNCKLEIHGDFIDLKASETITFTKNNEYRAIPLGVCIELPKHFIAKTIPRSSTFKRFRIIQSNSIGIIDYNYKGDNDQWFLPVVHFRKRGFYLYY